jgi:hypothetical protein
MKRLSLTRLVIVIVTGSLFLSFSKRDPGILKSVKGNAGKMDIWTASSYENIFKDRMKSNSDSARYSLVMAKNESESFQLLLRSDESFQIEAISFSNLASNRYSISNKNLRYNYVEYVYIKKNSWNQSADFLTRSGEGYYPDPLSNNKAIGVSVAETQPVWITITIPKDSKAGLYSGVISIRTSLGKYSIPVSVNVCDVTIPDPNKGNFQFMHHQQIAGTWFYDATAVNHPQDVITQIYGWERWTPQWWALVNDMAENLKRSRINVLFINTQQLLLDGGTKMDGDKYIFNWSKFDEYIQFFIDKGVVKNLEGIHFGSTIGAVGITYKSYILKNNANGQLSSTNVVPMEHDCNNFFSQFLPALNHHLKEKNWFDIWIQHIGDEAVSDLQHLQYGYYMAKLKQSAPGLKCGDPTFTLKSARLAVKEGATVVTPIEELYQSYKPVFDSLQSRGIVVYVYNCCGPGNNWLNRLIDKPVWNQRLLGWLCYKWGVSGWLHWGWNFWVDWFHSSFYSVNDAAFKGDNYTVYPDVANNRVKTSIRAEAIRDMSEEFELLRILGESNPVLTKEIIESVIVDASNNYTKDTRKMETARIRLLKACAVLK